MDKRLVYQTGAIAAVIGFICLLIMFVTQVILTPDTVIQPSHPTYSLSDFVELADREPRMILTFFAADSLFVLCYIIVFVGLHRMVTESSKVLIGVALGAGLFAALLDAIENGYFVTTVLSTTRDTLINQCIALIYVVGYLKYLAAFAFFFIAGLTWPRRTWLDWVFTSVMLLFVLTGIIGIIFPALISVCSLFLLVGMPLFAVCFIREIRSLRSTDR